MASNGTVIFNARALSVSRVIGVSLDVPLDVSFGLSIGLFFGRNDTSLLAVTGARQARIEGFGAIPFGSDDNADLRLSPRVIACSMQAMVLVRLRMIELNVLSRRRGRMVAVE